MSNLNPINKVFSLFFLVLFVSACSSTPEHRDNSTYTNKFSFEKKSFSSDRELLFSLLNRPLPEDQQMMLTFAYAQDSLASQYPQVSYVSIRGDRKDDKRNVKQTYAYSNLIYQDQNSILIGAPR